jgi:hypothetical protein
MFNNSITIIRAIQLSLRRARFQGRRVGIDTVENPRNQLPRRILSPLKAMRSLRRGGGVAFVQDLREEELDPILLEQRELVTNIALLHDAAKQFESCSNSPSVVSCAVVFDSWVMLQVKAMSERLEEISENVQETGRELNRN